MYKITIEDLSNNQKQEVIAKCALVGMSQENGEFVYSSAFDCNAIEVAATVVALKSEILGLLDGNSMLPMKLFKGIIDLDELAKALYEERKEERKNEKLKAEASNYLEILLKKLRG